jgi:kynurenine formamidase
MAIIDLTMPIETGMPVFPGDPQVQVETVHALNSHGWELRQLNMGSHTGTHVNAPSHMVQNGPALDGLPLDRFHGPAVLWKSGMKIPEGGGFVLAETIPQPEHEEELFKARPGFVAFSRHVPPSADMERRLLQAGILVYENLVHTEYLPRSLPFHFWGLPLAIINGDGSPVRAVAVVGLQSTSEHN